MTYVQGFLIPVPKDKREDYRKMAEAGWPAFRRLAPYRRWKASRTMFRVESTPISIAR